MSNRVFKKANHLTKRLLRHLLPDLVGVMVIALAFFIFTTATASTQFYYAVTELVGFTSVRDLNDLGQVVGYSSTSSGDTHASLWEKGKVTDLGTLPGGTNSYAYYINNKGQVVGGSSTSSGDSHAFLWENGTMTDLGTLPGDMYSEPRGVNERGQVIGHSYNYRVGSRYPSALQAFFWENGTMTNLGTLLPDDKYSYLYGINNRGQVIGNSSNFVYGPFHAFLWQNGRMTNLGSLNGTSSEVSAINNRGQVVGSSPTSSGFYHAFLWENGKMTDLYNLGKSTSRTSSINSKGQIVGTKSLNGRPTHAVLWQNANKITDLGTLNRKDYYSTASSINNAGKVIGQSLVSGSVQHPFLWDDGKMSDLNDLLPPNLGWVINSVQGINNRGQIFGMGKFNGNDRAFLLTPVRVTR